MSDTRLGINITANDTASAQIRSLQQTVRTLEQEIRRISVTAHDAGGAYVASLQRQIAITKEQIATLSSENSALDAQAAAIDRVTASMRSQASAASALRSSIVSQAQAEARAAAPRVASSASAAPSGLRAQMVAQAQAEMQMASTVAAAKIAADRQEAEYINRDMDLVAARARQQAAAISAANRAALAEQERLTRSEAEYENQVRDAIAAKARAEAAYENQMRDAIAARSRSEAEYENRSRDAIAAKARAEAEFENQMRDAAASRERAEAEYENRRRDAVALRQRQEAEYENAQRDAATRTAARSAAGIIAGAGPGPAAARAAAAAIASGATEAEAMAAGSQAATVALERQAVAARAVAAAEAAAGRAGADAGEIAAAGARAATESLLLQERAALAVARASAISPTGAGRGAQQAARFGVVEFDELMRGQRGQAIASIGAMARTSGVGVMGLTAAMTGLVVVMGTGAILRSAEHLAAFAAESQAAASAAGMSLQAYTSLSGAFDLIGLKGAEGDASLRHLSETLNTALADPASLAAQAFHNLGISQEQLIKNGQDAHGALMLLADAFQHTADGANKSANMAEIFGRGFERIIPLLQGGKEGLDSYEAEAKKLGLTLSNETAAKLEEAGRAVDHLSATMRGQGMQAIAAWSGAIIGLTHVLAAATAGLGYFASAIANLPQNVATVVGAANAALSQPHVAGQPYSRADALRRGRATAGGPTGDTDFGGGTLPGFAGAGVGAGDTGAIGQREALPLVRGGEVSALETMRQQMAQAEQRASQGASSGKAAREAEAQAEISVMQRTLATAKLNATQRAQIETELAQKQTTLRNEQLSGGGGAARQGTQDFIAQEKLKIAEAQGDSVKIKAIYDEMLAGLVASHKASAAQIANIQREEVQEVNKARLQEIKAGAQQEEQAARLLKLNSELASIASGKMKFQGQSEGPTADLDHSRAATAQAEQVRSMAQQEIAALEQVRATAVEGSDTQKAAAQEILQVEIQSKSQEIELYKEAGAAAVAAANKTNAAFKSMFDSIGSSAETLSTSLLKSLIAPQQDLIKAGLTTIKFSEQGNEMRAAFRTAILGIASDFLKSMEQSVGQIIANMLSKGAANSIGELLSQTLSKAVSSITGNAVGSAVGNVAGSAAGSAASSGITTAALVSNSVSTVTGVGTALTVQTTALSGFMEANTGLIVSAIWGAALEMSSAIIGGSANPELFGFKLSGGGIIPSAAGGMITGGLGGSLAILHAREMVLPAPISEGIQNMIARGGTSGGPNNSANLNYAPTINTASRGRGGTGMSRSEFTQMLSLHSGSLLGEAQEPNTQGWRPG